MMRLRIIGFCVLSLLFAGSVCAEAAPLPEWAWKGESYMNKKRTNTSYRFKVFKTEDASLTRLEEGRFYPLLAFLGEEYGADPATMVLDSLSNGPGEASTYRITIPEQGHTATVWAQRVDVYSTVDNNSAMDPVFEYYQLYAVSEKDADVLFDCFERNERSKAVAALMNLIPGTGQLYKGQTFKGGVILGSELLLGAAAISTHCKSLYYRDKVASGEPATDSWHSKEIGMRRLRNISLGAMAGIWAFSIYDALATDSMPNILVSAPEGKELTLSPSSEGFGIAFVYHF